MNRPAPPSNAVRLDALAKGRAGVVLRVESEAGAADALPPDALRRLVEIGFVDGERVEVIALAFPGGDPMAVRIGASQFALRRQEARAVLVAPDPA